MTRVRRYETMFVLKTTIEPEICAKQIETIKANITANGGEIEAVDDIGSKALAYEIDKNKRGYYFVIYFKAPTGSILELERLNNINENILRFIFIKFDTNKEIKNWDDMVAQTKNKKKQEAEEKSNEEQIEATDTPVSAPLVSSEPVQAKEPAVTTTDDSPVAVETTEDNQETTDTKEPTTATPQKEEKI